MSGAATKTKIAILGGGVGALAAAFDLTEVDPRGEIYDITIYQLGWRLGGKGAMGWTCEKYPTPGFEEHRVRLEHGLHVWAGFYDNAFDLMKRLYAAHDGLRDRSFMESFSPIDHCWVMDKGTGRWRPWYLHAPHNRRTPGLSRFPPSTGTLWRRLLAWTHTASLRAKLTAYLDAAHAAAPLALTQQEAEFAREASAIADGKAVEAFGVRPGDRKRVLDLVDFATTRLRTAYFHPEFSDAHGLDEPVRRLGIMANIAIALVLGLLDARVLVAGFDALDNQEWSYWMKSYGAWDVSVRSGLVKGFYDYIFAYDSNKNRNVAAGASTRALMRLLFSYKGSLFYRLNTTMGEFLFTPLYETLLKRMVKFEFFSRVDKLHLSADKKSIEKIDIGIQAKVTNEPYDPLVDIPGDGRSWPARPNYEQLEKGDELYQRLRDNQQDFESPWNICGVVDQKTLSRVQNGQGEFDKVILGISLGALGTICEDLVQENTPGWAEMINDVGACPTVATQLWTNTTAHDYHWPRESSVVTAFAAPLNTWGDNGQLVRHESWPDGSQPRDLGYFVGNLFPVDTPPTPNAPSDFPVVQLKRASVDVDKWVADDLPTLWPGVKPTDLRRPPWVRVNVNPSDLYVQSFQGSVEKRLAPDASGLDNLYLAGDWVRIAVNAGCIEQAVIGGRAAARAITGVDMNSQYDGDRNWDDERPMSQSISALLSNLPDLSKLAYAGRGSVDARCIVAFVPPKIVTNFLPPGLSFNLGAHEPDQLPVVLLFSEQSNVRPGFAPFGGIAYLEAAIVLTNVLSDDPSDDYGGPYMYMPRILLNSYPAAAIGANVYGFNKRMARMRRVGDSFQIRNSEGEIAASFQDASLLDPVRNSKGELVSSSEDGSLLGQIRDFADLKLLQGILELPIISETPQGNYIWSYIDYHLDQASFQPLKGECSIHQGPWTQNFTFDPVARAPAAAAAPALVRKPFGVRIVTNWSITLPVRMGEQDGLLQPKPKRQHAAAVTSRLMARLRGRR